MKGDVTSQFLPDPLFPPEDAAQLYGSLGGGLTWLYGFLPDGTIYGSSALPNGDRHAVLYTQDQLVDLNTEFISSLSWELHEILYGSATGVLVGTGIHEGRGCVFAWDPQFGEKDQDDSPSERRFEPIGSSAHSCHVESLGPELTVSPNPFTDALEVRYHVTAVGEPILEVFDAGGRRIRQLDHGAGASVGWRTIGWDGTDDDGKTVTDGVYFVRISTGVGSTTVTVVRLSR